MSTAARTSTKTPVDPAIATGERVYFAAVGVLALWVGVWGYFLPNSVTKALPFEVPPLHARFLGAVYLSGFVITLLSMLAPRWDEVRDVPVMAAIWTGGLGLISLLHLDAFPAEKAQTWIWFGAYLLYPVIALWLAWRHRGGANEVTGASVPRWARRYLLVQGVVLVVTAGMLLLLPDLMVELWPWPITRMLAQLYSAPLLAYGVGSLLLARRRSWREIRVPVIGMLVFAVLVLVASAIHRDLFSSTQAADVVWFAVLVAISASLALLGARAVAAGRPVAASR
jgi:hypothetical protein